MSEYTSRFPQLRVSMPRHNGEGYAKLTARPFEQMNATLGKNRWCELFGTSERAALTICRQLKHGNICTCDGCPVKPLNRECDNEYDALLEWLEGESQ